MQLSKLLFLCTLLGLGLQLKAQEANIEAGNITVVTNPAYFFLGGYHLKPSWHFPKRWSIGATLQGGFTLPDFARDQFFEVSDDGTDINWDYAIGLELKYRFTDAPYDKGFYTAFNLGYEGWEAELEGQSDRFQNWFTSIDVGYNWYPFERERVHLGLAYTLIFLLNNTDERPLGDTSYRLRSVVPPSAVPSIFVGWRF